MRSFVFHKKPLLLVSCILLFLVTMGQQAGITVQGHYMTSVFDPSFEKALYKGSMDISKYHFSGIFLLKKTSERSFRIVFSNELGMSFYDLELKGDEFIVHSCMPLLNKAPLLKLLEHDFRLLLVPDTTIFMMKRGRSPNRDLTVFAIASARGSFHNTYEIDSGRIRRIQTSRSSSVRTDLQIPGYEGKLPRKITISNPTIRLHVQMTLLSN
jgi:hypothetical protein